MLAELRECPGEVVRRCAGYVEANRERMLVAVPRTGLPAGSGVVESAHGAVVADRPKRGGLCWTVAGVNAVLALRRWTLNGRFDEFRPPQPDRHPLRWPPEGTCLARNEESRRLQ